MPSKYCQEESMEAEVKLTFDEDMVLPFAMDICQTQETLEPYQALFRINLRLRLSVL